jgi:hypothetical protein
MAVIKISDLPSADPLTDTDIFPASQGSDTNGVTWGDMLEALTAYSNAVVIPQANYTEASPASASTITFQDTTGLSVGTPLVIVSALDSVPRYYIVSGISGTTPTITVTINGPDLQTGNAITSIAILPVSRVVQADFFFPGGYDLEGSTSTLLQRTTLSFFRWHMPKAKLVRAVFAHATAGTSGTQPKVNVLVAGSAAFTDDTNAGATLSTANTKVRIGLGTASSANYSVEFNDDIEFVLVAGTSQDARDLTASLTFVLE